MMTTLERKKYLKNKIDTTDDFEILDKIEKIFQENEGIYILSDEQILKVQEARAEFLSGGGTSHEDEINEIEEWFRKEEK